MTRTISLYNEVQQAGDMTILPIDLVEFTSAGHLLIIGQAQQINSVLPYLADLTISVICTDDEADTLLPGITIIAEKLKKLDGWLGQFVVELESKQLKVDLLLDLADKPQIPINVPPLGYFAPREDAQALAQALQQLPNLVGTFDKPRYFEYKAAICAHARRGLNACQQCIDNCPAYAISSDKDAISVNPSLCQGCGTCTSVCPSGAISYALPTLEDSLNSLRKMIQTYCSLQDDAPDILIHDVSNGQQLIDAMGEQLPNTIILFAIEEIGAVSMAFWLTALAYGARSVTVWNTFTHKDHDWLGLQQEISKTNQMLMAMAYPQKIVNWFEGNDVKQLAGFISNIDNAVAIDAATYAGINDKRDMIKLAMQHLYEQTKPTTTVLALDKNAAFGEIKVDTKTCTLCMSCVSVCPVGAVLDGVDKPQLHFIEDVCVQCGLCEQACPENAIELNARFLLDSEAVRKPRLLHEEAVFHCISCDKPFATQKMIDVMTEKLKGHSMFQGPALERLKMCEDCRVKVMFKDGTM